MLSIKKASKLNNRNFSRFASMDKTSKAIRQKFLDYFINKYSHNFIKSSPVVPFCDPSVAFVNAGMNQFKGVFLGTQEPPYKKVTNSQKCIRVGGKHNDLNVIGTDGYHHTFFEMLGNWSFGDYFKKEACELAWNLLTHEYKIHPSRLYVTYFKGDPSLGLKEDLETKEIWKSIGLPEHRILPFGSSDNFWEMGSVGPCGPCTEIHFDHTSNSNRAKFVNKGLHDLTELWNLVFIQYNRKDDGTIELLPHKHVDTGMGFERLTSVLQGKISNYDTDNFSYLLKAINKNCKGIPPYKGTFGEKDWDSLDTSYRILSDHTRMITACLADGVIPEQNQKLRRIMRKAFLLSETAFKKEKGLLKELSNYVIEHLGPVYNEMERNVKQIHQIIDYEEEIFKQIRKTATEEWEELTKANPRLQSLDLIETPSIVAAYKNIKSTNPKSIDGKVAFKLFDCFGLDEEAISKLAETLNLKFDPNDLQDELDKARERSKKQDLLNHAIIYEQLHKANVAKTDVSDIYNYEKEGDKYVFNKLDVNILKIIQDCNVVEEVGPDTYCSLVLDKSNLYTEAGGQIGDEGSILFGSYLFEIKNVQNCNGYILHNGFLRASKNYRLQPDDSGVLYLDTEIRLNNMKNHTAIHLLNAVLKETKGATCQKSSKVTDDFLNFDVAIFGDKLTVSEVETVENKIEDLIDSNIPVVIKEVDSQVLNSFNDITLIPGEIYPDRGVRLVEIKGLEFISREPCCGTHVLNTADLEDFCIISVKSLGRSITSIHAVTGDRARVAKENGIAFLETIENFEKIAENNLDKPEALNKQINALKLQLNYNIEDGTVLPWAVKHQCLEVLNKISKQVKESEMAALKQFIESEMRNALVSKVAKTKNRREYVVHCLKSAKHLEVVPLQKATKLCPDIPVLVISYSDNMVKARCCVPKELANDSFSAEKWLKESVASIFKSNIGPPKGQDGNVVCNMRVKRVSNKEMDQLLQESLQAAKRYVEENL